MSGVRPQQQRSAGYNAYLTEQKKHAKRTIFWATKFQVIYHVPEDAGGDVTESDGPKLQCKRCKTEYSIVNPSRTASDHTDALCDKVRLCIRVCAAECRVTCALLLGAYS